MLQIVNTLVQGILHEFRLLQRNALASAPLYLAVAVVHDVDVTGTHVDSLGVLDDPGLSSLTKH